MEERLLTVSEFAILAGKKPQTIYKQLNNQLNNRFNPYVQLVDNRKMLKSSALYEIYGITVEQPIQPELNNSFNQSFNPSNDEIVFLREQVKQLQTALDTERQHSRELADRLAVLAKNAQELHAGTMTRQLNDGQADPRGGESAAVSSPGIFGRIFRRKK